MHFVSFELTVGRRHVKLASVPQSMHTAESLISVSTSGVQYVTLNHGSSLKVPLSADAYTLWPASSQVFTR